MARRRAGRPGGAGGGHGSRPLECGDSDKSLREQDIYIPYEKLRQVFEKHGRGVFLPYEKFEELWRAAQDKTRPAGEPRPPVGAVITEIENEAVVAKDVVRVKATVTIDLLAEGWHEIPLRLSDAAITSATLAGEPARIVGGPGEDYRLLVEKKGKKAEQIVLSLEYAKAISKMPGQNSVSFQAPQAPVSRWRVRIPQAGVKVNIFPLIAATEVPPAETKGEKVEKGKVRRESENRPRPTKPWCWPLSGRPRWSASTGPPRPKGATGLAALVSVQAEQQVWINEGAARSRTNLTYAISRAELGQLAVEVPADYKVVNVFDANVRQWSVEPPAAGAKRQKITAQLFEPAKSAPAGHRGTGKIRRRQAADLAQRAAGQGPGRRPPAGDRGRPGGCRAAGRGHADHRPAATGRQRTARLGAAAAVDLLLSVCFASL